MLTDEQLAQRKGRVTSSLAAAALGLSTRMTPLGAKLAILGLDDFKGSPATERGDVFEKPTLQWGADQIGAESWSTPPFVAMEDWAGDSCDAHYRLPGGVLALGEAKTCGLGVAAEYREEGTDQVPEGTLIQAHWHLAAWPMADVCYIPVLVGGYDFRFRLYKVRRDPTMQSIILSDLRAWWEQYIRDDETPPVTAGDEAWLAKRFPRGDEKFMPDNQQLAQLCEQAHYRIKERKAAELEEAKLKAAIAETLGHHTGCKADWGSVYYNARKMGAKIDWKTVAMELDPPQELIDRCTHIPTGKPFVTVHYRGAGK